MPAPSVRSSAFVVTPRERAPDWAVIEANPECERTSARERERERGRERESFSIGTWSRYVLPMFFPSEFLRVCVCVCAFGRGSRNNFELANKLQLELKLNDSDRISVAPGSR